MSLRSCLGGFLQGSFKRRSPFGAGVSRVMQGGLGLGFSRV